MIVVIFLNNIVYQLVFTKWCIIENESKKLKII